MQPPPIKDYALNNIVVGETNSREQETPTRGNYFYILEATHSQFSLQINDGPKLRGKLARGHRFPDAFEIEKIRVYNESGTAQPLSIVLQVGKGEPLDNVFNVTSDVSGPLTDAQLRASAVPFSAAALPLPAGAATAANQTTANNSLSNIDADLGSSADAAASTDDGTFSLIALFKRSLNRLTNIFGSSADAAASTDDGTFSLIALFKRFLTRLNDAEVIGPAGVTSGNNCLDAGNAWTLSSAYSSGSVHIIATAGISAGAVTFEQSNDGVNATLLPVKEETATAQTMQTSAITIGANSVRMFVFSTKSKYIRLRVSTGFTGGSIQAFGNLSMAPFAGVAINAQQATAANFNTTTTLSALPALVAGTARVGFISAAGIWFDDSTSVLAGNATFTGSSRDATVTATATAFANAATYATEVRVSAETDQTGTLWVEFSRDNSTWRRAKSSATAAVTGGGQYAEIVFRPSWRYWRAGFTNGATLQTRFTIGSIATA